MILIFFRARIARIAIATISRAITVTKTTEKTDIEASDRAITERLQKSAQSGSEEKKKATMGDLAGNQKTGAVDRHRAKMKIA
jgi:hypothetical protein